MGVTEEAGKLAGGVVDAMKGVPMLLAMLLINLIPRSSSTDGRGRRQFSELVQQVDLIARLVPTFAIAARDRRVRTTIRP
jgi:hypothetical protein